MAGQYAFISYARSNSDFVDALVAGLKKDGVWVDKWDMDLGDELPLKVESGISQASEFILVLSDASLQSRWVRYESHMAAIRALEDSNFRMVVVRIDHCKVPLRFKPFLYVDSPGDLQAAISRVQEFLQKRRLGQGAEPVLYRRHFVDRAHELGSIEGYVNDPDVTLICLQGFFGIGKRTLAEESIRRLWQNPDIAPIQLTQAHLGARLCLDLCATAGIELPADGASPEDLKTRSWRAAETIISNRRIILLDQFESILDDEGAPNRDVEAVLRHLADMSACSKIPVFVLSRRMPRFDPIPPEQVGLVRVRGMETEHIVTILENETARIERRDYGERNSLVTLAAQLYGYPLAGRLAAPLLVKHSPEYLLENLSHIKRACPRFS